jgi:hypothetical protein
MTETEKATRIEMMKGRLTLLQHIQHQSRQFVVTFDESGFDFT